MLHEHAAFCCLWKLLIVWYADSDHVFIKIKRYTFKWSLLLLYEINNSAAEESIRLDNVIVSACKIVKSFCIFKVIYYFRIKSDKCFMWWKFLIKHGHLKFTEENIKKDILVLCHKPRVYCRSSETALTLIPALIWEKPQTWRAFAVCLHLHSTGRSEVSNTTNR